MSWSSGFQFRILKGNQPGLTLPLNQTQYILGRAISHQDVAPGRLYFQDQSVALVQAKLQWDKFQEFYRVSHESGQAKSWVSGLPLVKGAPLPLKPGSKLKLGKLVLILEKDPGAPSPPPESPEVIPELPLWKEQPVTPVPERAAPEESGEFVLLPPAPPESKVDASWFSGRTYSYRDGEMLHGPVAEFFENGQLKRLSIYQRGQLSNSHHQLLLEYGLEVGRVVSNLSECTFSQGLEMVITELEGEVDFFEEPAEWESWVRKWLKQICANQTVIFLAPGQSL
jgi:hypothetical protein